MSNKEAVTTLETRNIRRFFSIIEYGIVALLFAPLILGLLGWSISHFKIKDETMVVFGAVAAVLLMACMIAEDGRTCWQIKKKWAIWQISLLQSFSAYMYRIFLINYRNKSYYRTTLICLRGIEKTMQERMDDPFPYGFS